LRSTAVGHRPLDRVQLVDITEPLGGDDLLVVQPGRGDQAGIDRGPPAGSVAGRAGHHHRAGAALALRAALLAAGETGAAQPLEQGDVAPDVAELVRLAVDCHLRLHVTNSCSGHDFWIAMC